MHVSPAKEFIYIVSLSFSKIDNNYDKHLKFFQEWEIKEVKVCYACYTTFVTSFQNEINRVIIKYKNLPLFKFFFYYTLFTMYVQVSKNAQCRKEEIKTMFYPFSC